MVVDRHCWHLYKIKFKPLSPRRSLCSPLLSGRLLVAPCLELSSQFCNFRGRRFQLGRMCQQAFLDVVHLQATNAIIHSVSSGTMGNQGIRQGKYEGPFKIDERKKPCISVCMCAHADLRWRSAFGHHEGGSTAKTSCKPC